MKKLRFIAIIGICILTAFAQESTASDLVTYQGKLADASSQVLPDGQYWLGVRVWDVAAGGDTPLWARKYQVPVTGGLFSMMLGAEGTPWETPVPLTSSLNLALSSGNRFLEVTVMSDANGVEKAEGEWQALLPRQSLASVPTAMNGVPPGTVVPFAGIVIPDGWVLCDGSTLDGADPRFAPLFAAIQTAYGAGADSQFNIPDLRGRTPIGSGKGDTWIPGGSDQSTTWALGQKFGAERHQLSVAEMPKHNHNVRDLGHDHPVSPDKFAPHSNSGSGYDDASSGGSRRTGANQANIAQDDRGSDQPHNNMQPSLVLNYIIKL